MPLAAGGVAVTGLTNQDRFSARSIIMIDMTAQTAIRGTDFWGSSRIAVTSMAAAQSNELAIVFFMVTSLQP